MRTAVKAWILKFASLITSAFIAIYCVGAGAVIFTRSIEIISAMHYTNAESAGIIVGIGALLIWIIVLGAESAEHILKAGYRKANNFQQGENNE
jgi:ABC-type nickel/cobalt efflux system permease component RcnA